MDAHSTAILADFWALSFRVKLGIYWPLSYRCGTFLINPVCIQIRADIFGLELEFYVRLFPCRLSVLIIYNSRSVLRLFCDLFFTTSWEEKWPIIFCIYFCKVQLHVTECSNIIYSKYLYANYLLNSFTVIRFVRNFLN